MAVIVLVGSVGLTINAHYCSTQKTLQKSLFTAEIHCNHESHSCDIVAMKHDTAQACCTVHQVYKQTKDCCTDFSKYVKLVTEFDLPKIKVVFNHFLTVVVRLFELVVPVTEDNKTSVFSDAPDDTNLPGSGTKFLIACSQLKLAHHLL